LESFEELWSQFDESDNDSHKRGLCLVMMDATQDETLRAQIKAEYDMFDFYLNNLQIIDSLNRSDKERFKDNVQEFIKFHTTRDLSYYRKRLNETNKISNKWRYSLICWLLQKKQFSYFKNAILTLLNCVRKNYKNGLFIQSIKLLICAYHLVSIFDTKKRFAKYLAKESFLIINDAKDTERRRWICEPIEILCQLDILNHTLSSNLIKILESQTHKPYHSANEKNINSLGQSYLMISIGLVRFLDLDSNKKNDMRERIRLNIGQLWEEEGDYYFSHEQPETSFDRYKKSHSEYSQAGKYGQERKRSVELKIAKAYQNFKWNTFEAKLLLPSQSLEQFLKKKFKDLSENDIILTLIRKYQNMITLIDKSELQSDIKENQKRYPLASIIPHTYSDGKNPVLMDEDIQNYIEPELSRRISEFIQLNELQLSIVVQRLQHRNKLSALGIINLLASFEVVDDMSLNLISRAISRHFKGDYVSSIHILIPQIERILRTVLVHNGINSATEFSQKYKRINESLLKPLVRQFNVREFLGENLSIYLEIKFTNQLGLNLRNRLSHGLLDSLDDCNHSDSYSLIMMIFVFLMRSIS